MLLTSNRRRLGILAYFAATTAIFFRGPLLFPQRYILPFDIEGWHHPLSEFIAWSFREAGSLPWWNPFSYMGEPFFTNIQAAMFYPPTLAAVLFSNFFLGGFPYWVTEILLIAHVTVAGLGAFLLLRSVGATMYAALGGATLYHLGAFFASQTQHTGAVSASAWLPWFVSALRRLEQKRDATSVGLAALPGAMMILAGFPAAFLPLLIVAPILYGSWMWGRNPVLQWRPHARAIVLLAAAFALAALLSAISWLPGYQGAVRSMAAIRPLSQATGGFRPEAAVSIVWPNLFGQLRGEYWLSSDDPTFMHLYHTVPALLLVGSAFIALTRMTRARPFLIAGTVSLLWMFGSVFFLSHIFFFVFPEFLARGIYPKFVLPYFSLCFAVLAGLAADAYERGERHLLVPFRTTAFAAGTALLLGMAAMAAGLFVSGNPRVIERATTAGGSLIIVGAILCCLCLVVRTQEDRDSRGRRRATAVLCVLLAFDLVTIGSDTKLNTQTGTRGGEPAAITRVRELLGPLPMYRIDTSGLDGNWLSRPMEWRIPSANGSNPLLLRDTWVYRAPFSGEQVYEFSLEDPDSPLVDLAGIRYILTPRSELPGVRLIHSGDVNIFENPRALPRFFLVGGIVTASEMSESIRVIHERKVDPSKVAVVSQNDARHFHFTDGTAGREEIGTVTLLSYRPNEVVLQSQTSRPAVLVSAETFWPDWRATLNGIPHPLVRANGIFRALPVPAGTHEIRMYLAPRRLYIGAALSLLGLACVTVIFIARSRRRSMN